MTRRLSPTTPLTEAQLARRSPVPASTLLYLEHAPAEVALTYAIITSLGSLLAPDGTDRKLEARESPIGLLLPISRRRQLSLQIGAARSEVLHATAAELPMKHRLAADRRFNEHLRLLGELGLVHRCCRGGSITVYLRPHLEGAGCEWVDCPTGVFEKPAMQSRRQSQRLSSTEPASLLNRARVSVGPIGERSGPEYVAPPAATAPDQQSQRLSRNSLSTKDTKSSEGTCQAQEEKEAMERLKTVLGAVEMHTTPSLEIETTLTDLVVAQFMAGLQEEGVAVA